MTDQTIPADKVRELIEHFEGAAISAESREVARRFRALLPAQQLTSGLLGRWAKHPEHGDVVCIWDKPMEGRITVWYRNENSPTGSLYDQVPLDSLTFPHQATRPADVPAGEVWRIRDALGREFNAVKTSSGYHATDSSGYTWLFCDGDGDGNAMADKGITLVCPLTPERPVSDLQAKYDALEAKYLEAQERIKTLEKASTPQTVTTPEEYDALPVGSQVKKNHRSYVWLKRPDGMWWTDGVSDKLHNNITCTVLRYGWGDEQPEQPAWRIEHDPKNLREGEYIINNYGDGGTVESWHHDSDRWFVLGGALANPDCAPFIAFPNVGAATPEAVAEAKKARDGEMEQ